MSAKSIATAATAIASLVAALLWFYSDIAQVPYALSKPGDMSEIAIVKIDDNYTRGIDVLRTAERQTFWNRWAAIAAGIAATCQTVSLMLPDYSSRESNSMIEPKRKTPAAPPCTDLDDGERPA